MHENISQGLPNYRSKWLLIKCHFTVIKPWTIFNLIKYPLSSKKTTPSLGGMWKISNPLERNWKWNKIEIVFLKIKWKQKNSPQDPLIKLKSTSIETKKNSLKQFRWKFFQFSNLIIIKHTKNWWIFPFISPFKIKLSFTKKK